MNGMKGYVMLESAADAIRPMLPLMSMVGSTVSLGITSYFWFVKMNRERPQLHCEAVEHASYIDLDQCTSEERWLNFRVSMVVANESTLPNAVMHVDVQVKPKAEGRWVSVPRVRPVQGSNFPVNMLPLQSGLLTVEWEMSFPYLEAAEQHPNPADSVAGYLQHYWESSEQITIQLKGLRNTSFTHQVKLLGSRMSSSIRHHLDVTQLRRAA